MIKPTLFVDVDSTIYDLDPMLVRATREITGETLTEGEINEWNYLHNRYGGETAHLIFALALSPHNIWNRALYPGCSRFLYLLKDMGCEIVFATHNHDPDGMREALTDWIWSHFFPAEILITTSEHSKIKALLQRPAPLGIIDDKGSTLEEAAEANLIAASLRCPWNRYIEEKRDDVLFFDNWGACELLLDRIKMTIKCSGDAPTPRS